MREMLETLGFVGALIARDKGGEVELLDGELRSDIAAEAEVPVLIVDLTDEEADRMLATYDPLAGLSLVDAGKLGGLLEGVSLDENGDLRRMLADLTAKLEKEEDEDDEPEREVVGMALQPHEHYDYLVVLCTTAQEWNVLCDKLELKPEKRRGRMGTSRAIRASQLLKALK